MLLRYSKLISFLLVLFFCTPAFAETAHINYTDTNMYNKLKGELEGHGFTVTGTNSGSVTLSDFTGKDLHINIAGSSNCGSNCKTAYETYIGAGGTVLIAGNGDHDGNRTLSIESLVESKLSVGAITIYNGEANYTSHANGSQYTTSNYWVTRNLFSMQSGGTAIASNSQAGSSWKTWAVYGYGSNGGKLIITLDQAQFNSTNTDWSSRMYTFLGETLEEEGVFSSTVNITSTSGQTTIINTAKTTTGNGIKLNVDGDSNTINIEQTGENNFLIGTDWSSDATITGDNNTLNVDQGNVTTSGNSGNNGLALDITGDNNNVDIDQLGNDNVLGIDVIGSSNDVDVIQNQDQRAKLSITGNSNTANLNQSAINYVGEHYMSVIIAGNSNILDLDQTETGNKKLFLDIDGSNNVTVDQKGTGNHYSEITLTDSHTVDVTQDGSGDHNATINLSGNPSTVNLTQDSSTDQNYHLQQSCVTNTCSVTVTQN